MKFSTLLLRTWILTSVVLAIFACSSENGSASYDEEVQLDQKIEILQDFVAADYPLQKEKISSASVPTIEVLKSQNDDLMEEVLKEPTVARQSETPTTVPNISVATIEPISSSTSSSSTTSVEDLKAATDGKMISISFQEGSIARYKIGEQFARLPTPITAIGETSGIVGKIYLNQEGYLDEGSASIITVDVKSLKSDENKRDNWVRRNGGIGSEITINISEVIGHLWPLPTTGEMALTVKGDMTISKVTKPVVWEGLLAIEDRNIAGSISTIITWDQFSLSKPRLPFIISVDDEIILELDVVAEIQE